MTKWRVRVQIDKEWYSGLKAYLLDIALHRSAAGLGRGTPQPALRALRPVRQQLLNLIRHINHRREPARLEPFGFDVLRYRRRIVRPFEPGFCRRP